MRIFLIVYFILSIFCISVAAQTDKNITLKVLNKIDNQPIQAVLIEVVKDKSLYQTSTDSTGSFVIPKAYLTKDYLIKASVVNFIKISIKGDIFNAQGSNSGILQLTPTAHMLKEVIVKGERRYRDTTKIDLSGQYFERSVMIDDLFSGGRGLYKDNKGQLYYNGKRVTDIFVNGGEFFGKNNMTVYKDLPALTIDNISIIETNIEDLTNATLAKPTVKIDLKLKEKFNKGKFGNLTVSAGSLARYFINTDLYTYNKNQQISFAIAGNNVSDRTLAEPNITFLPNGNDIKSYSSRFSYHKSISKRLNLDIAVKGKKQGKNYQAESERKEEILNQFSTTNNSSSMRSYNLDPSNISLNYKIDSLAKINFNGIFSYRNETQVDSLRYVIKNDNLNTNASVDKLRKSANYTISGGLIYEQQLTSKKGRFLQFNFNYTIDDNKVNEQNGVSNMDTENKSDYYIIGHRNLKNEKTNTTLTYNEPILTNGTFQLILNYNTENLAYAPDVYADKTVAFADSSASIAYNNYQIGSKIRKSFRRFSFDESVTGVLFSRNTHDLKNKFVAFYPVLDFSINYKVNKRDDINLQYKISPNYPDAGQITSISNTFDLISQSQGNIYLNPEIKSNLNFLYNIRKSDSSSFSLTGNFEHFRSKFGYKIGNLTNNNQISSIDNLRNSNSGQLSFSWNKLLKSGGSFAFNSIILYAEMPTINSDISYVNKSMTYNQTISLGVSIIKSRLTIKPTINVSFSKLTYQLSNSNIFTLIYSDKITYQLGKIQISTYPLFNLSHNSSLNSAVTWAMNGDVKLDIFKKNGSLWLKAYDIFNSFKYYNNYAGPNFTQTMKYSNLNRYFLLGISFKMNDMKN